MVTATAWDDPDARGTHEGDERTETHFNAHG
jgi:hypothetical protein